MVITFSNPFLFDPALVLTFTPNPKGRAGQLSTLLLLLHQLKG